MELYLYLTKPCWVDKWITGGKVPFYVASKYKRNERSGVFTPDENLIETSTFDVQQYSPSMKFADDVSDINFIGFEVNGKVLNGTVNRRVEDGLVICMSTKRSKFIARKLGKKACVKINDVEKLKKCVDLHTGVNGIAGLCEYTASYKRDHFLKSTYDEWQREYRLFWLGVGNIDVELPPGLGELEFILP
ncbi:hypothetical protein [Klebsiella pneumoniae]|uniref:hypothetical protein n=1 Tax=Klebsiella pneumoniae TaxID=573 RepID=UPI00164B7078|nr:hypothetical protein [Klebsiella pneumoniae]HDT1534500.1 hypothetical protein [Klebsiella pneumoniae subsp. pneumoniae]MBC4816892.1 hypothetical protein [Klebsiella pneumoniae]MBC4827119.1 hypothetical protein [Klebsiella pneumoniae]MBX4636143.1 hypothetical protein [Klebsiella pneumoniae]HBR7612474.1 hypothetical protein [Klebsiella pneumoniae]